MAYPGYGGGAPGYGAPPGAPPPGAYHPAQGGYPPAAGYPGGPPGGVDPLYGYFSAVAGADQQIDARELQRCLTSSGIAGSYQQFNLDTCRIMITMLDRDYSGKMGFTEFKELWGVLNHWKNSFATYDRDRSGTVEPHELHAAVASFGYRLSPQALSILVKRYSTDGRIAFDDFVACCIRLRSLTDSFRKRDTAQQGVASFGYDDFIQVGMYI
ncbi:sorcin-like [Oscarella lobularis]|uniref:sorcin-like n=1 Tax=Oscarella lobularis TaxID=121494 RepID=UPI003313773A